MKKTLFLLCSTMLLWMGCAEDDSLKNENLGFKTIGAVIEQGNTNSRVQVNDNNSGGATLSWVTDDAFNTFGDITAEYKYDGSVFNVVGTIPQTINYAVYPSSDNLSISGTTLTLNLEKSFSNKEKESKLPMWAGAPVSNQLSFKHLAALLKIDLTGIENFTSIEVTADKAIAGDFTADLNVENPELSVSTGNTEEANKTVTITLTGNTTGGAEVIYLPIPAATYESLKVTAKGSNNTEKLLKSWTDLTFERAKMYTASIVNLSTPSDVTSALEDLSTTPVVLNLAGDFTTDENDSQITIPNVDDSDLTLNFVSIPITTEDNPLVIESENETNVGEATKELTINIPAEESGEDTYLTINTPTTTVTVAGGNYATLTATTATNTLIIKSGVEIANLVINGGNVVIEEGATVTDITNEFENTISYLILVSSETELKEKLEAAGSAGAGDTMIGITKDLDMTSIDWTPIYIDGYHGADIVTVEGYGHSIKGLKAGLFKGGFAGGSGLVIKNLTIEKSTIVANETLGYGAFVGCADSMDEITLINCHLKESNIITPNDGADESRIGGLIGWTAGYNNQNDGPVDSYITVKDCSVIGCTLKGAGSIGGIVGHAGANAATFTTIENCILTNNHFISTDDGGWRVGVVVGTANNGQCVINNITESDNTLSQTGKTAPTEQSNLYGRFVPSGTGTLEIDGISM